MLEIISIIFRPLFFNTKGGISLDNIYSPEKVKIFKSKLMHFNHTQELQKFDKKDLDYYPEEFQYFGKNNKSYDTLAYCNAIYFDYLSQIERPEINSLIARVIGGLEKEKIAEIKTAIVEQSIAIPLQKRARATYQIDLDRSAGDRFTHSLLHIYSSAYENTEALFVLKWIMEGLQKEPLTTNFNRYRDNFGNILKGRLLSSIFKVSKNYPDFHVLLKTAYNKEMRHLCFHNEAELNDKERKIVGIENSDIKISYKKAFESLYALQQIHNYIRLWTTILLIEEKYIVNEGIFNAGTVHFAQGDAQLFLFQLFPFYESDLRDNKKIEEIWVKEENNLLKFYTPEKEIISLKKDLVLSAWYKEKKDLTVRISAAYSDIFEDDNLLLPVRTEEYGAFAIDFGYEAQLHFK